MLAEVDSLELVGRKRDRGKTRSSVLCIVLRNFCYLPDRAHRCRTVSSSAHHWKVVSYRFLALVRRQCHPFFWGLLQMLWCFTCLSECGVRDNRKGFVERQQAKEGLMAAPRWISLMNFCNLTVCYLSPLQTCKTFSEKHSVLLLTFLLSVSKIWCHQD